LEKIVEILGNSGHVFLLLMVDLRP
jgi:hypothetical protein